MGNVSANTTRARGRSRSTVRSPSQARELLIQGYWRHLRNLPLPPISVCSCTTESSHNIIIITITSYYYQSHAKYLELDGASQTQLSINNAIAQHTAFGDIVHINYSSGIPFLAVINKQHRLIPCFLQDSGANNCIEIPFEICQHLDNSYHYYTPLMTHPQLATVCNIQRWHLIVTHKDTYCVSKFQHALSAKYSPIKLCFETSALHSFTIGLNKAIETIFHEEHWSYSRNDIDSFFAIRKRSSSQLMSVEIQHKAHTFQQNSFMFPSGQWEYTQTKKQTLILERFVGPLHESQAMMDTVRLLYFGENLSQQTKHGSASSTAVQGRMSYNTNTKQDYAQSILISFVPEQFETFDILDEQHLQKQTEGELHKQTAISALEQSKVSNVSRWDLELLDESKCLSVTPAKLKDIMIRCPSRTHLYTWKLFYSTEFDGLSTQTMYSNLADVSESVLLVRTTDGSVFGAFIDCRWVKPEDQKRTNGKIPYRGSVDCFVFRFDSERCLEVYKGNYALPYFVRNDLKGVTVGAGECAAIWFDYSFRYGRSVACETYGSPRLSASEQFSILKVEVWAPME